MECGLSALNLKQEVISHNLANIDTPNYKSYEVNFENVLEQAYQSDKDDTAKNISYDFKAEVSKDNNLSVLVDGNNVDVDEQSLELYSTYVQSSAIIQKMNAKISDINYVLTQANFN
jgi:flagellar basal-body rod protein FlgB